MLRSRRPLPGNESARTGFTVLELLVTLMIVALLVALLLPAIQQSREAARLTQCRSQLQQLALAIQNHESTYMALPSDGWGWKWIGEPDRGVGIEQPGGWIYQLLPHLERNDLRQLGAGLADAERRIALGNLTAVPLPVVRCPSRPAPALASGYDYFNAERRPAIGRTDYAINAGDVIYDDPQGPRTLAEGDASEFAWPDTEQATGVCFLRSTIRWRDVSDGLTNTLLIGEKRVSTEFYANRGDAGYDQSPFTGADVDIHRWTEFAPDHDSAVVDRTRFGSAHRATLNVALCDGSVRSLGYQIDAEIFRRLGHRHDGGPSGLSGP